VKEGDHALDCVKLDQIFAFGAHLLGANGIGATRRECAPTSRHVKPIVSGDLELAGEELVGGFLQAPVRAGDNHRIWSGGCPSEGGWFRRHLAKKMSTIFGGGKRHLAHRLLDSHLSPSGRSPMAKDRVIANQSRILANQRRIEANQAKLDKVLANQARIVANQNKIVANQNKILSNQKKILAKK
jgi:hypothetical protein